MTAFVDMVDSQVEKMRRSARDRDARMAAVTYVMSNRASMVFRGMFPSDWPEPVVANTIKSAVKDAAYQIGVLPTLRTAAEAGNSDAARARADKLARIIGYLAYASSLGTEMVYAATQYQLYGFAPLRVEPNFDDGRAHIGVDSCLGAYYTQDRFQRVTSYARVRRMRTSDLIALYPEHEGKIRRRTGSFNWGPGSDDVDDVLDVVRFDDDDVSMMYLPQRDNVVLDAVDQPLGRVPVRIAAERSVDGEDRGEMDDALWVYAAKARLALLTLEGATKAVEAPIVVPPDVEQFEFGPDALLRTNNPQGVRRVGLEIPSSSMFELNQLDNELKLASHYPDVRAGQTDASVVTGRGVQALMGGFDQRIKAAQSQLGATLSDALSDALELERTLFSDETKKVYASVNGTAYELTYTPGRDIYSTNVSAEYGIMAGMDPNRSLIWSLQALGAGLVSEEFVRSNLPVNLNPLEETKRIDVEGLRKAMMAATQNLAMALPELVAQGQDPTRIIIQISDIIDDRKRGTPIEVAAKKAFTPPEPTPEELAAQQEAAAMQMPPDPNAPPVQPGMPGQPGMPMPPGALELPGQMAAPPTQQQLLAQLSGDGASRSSARTVRNRNI